LVLVAGFSGSRLLGQALSEPARPVAVLYDQLALDDPREGIEQDIRGPLESAGYDLKRIPPEETSVRRFAALPKDRAKLLILRTHAALVVEDGQWTEDVALFTSQAIDLGLPSPTRPHAPPAASMQRSISVAADDRPFDRDELAALVPVQRTSGTDQRPLYGVGARFVREHLEGNLDDAVVVLMGCDGLRGRAMSEAFLGRGARAVIGWSDEVSAAHTDRATAALVRSLAAGATIADAVKEAMLQAGPDPQSGAYLIAAVR
jgi:hypothetical protein